MNINQVVCIRSNWFAEIKTETMIGDAGQWDCRLRISSAHYRRTRQFLKAEDFRTNSVILTGKYNKGYRLHVARQFHMLWKTRGHENNPRQTSNIAACQHDASSEDCLHVLDLKQRCMIGVWCVCVCVCVCVSSKYPRAIREQTSPNTLSPYDHHTLLSRVTWQYNRSLCGWEIAFFHIAILSPMQLIVQPYLTLLSSVELLVAEMK